MAKGTGAVIVALMLLCISACSAKVEERIVYVDKPVTVEVPVLKTPEFTRPSKPKNYLNSIGKDSTPKEVAEAYVNALKEWKRYARKLEVLVEPYFKKD